MEKFLAQHQGDRPLIECVEEFARGISGENGFKVSRATLLRWRSLYRRKGIDGLIDGRRYAEPARSRRIEIPKELL